jgi:hypothetical protein
MSEHDYLQNKICLLQASSFKVEEISYHLYLISAIEIMKYIYVYIHALRESVVFYIAPPLHT